MAATGFTPVQLYHSTTAAAAPSAGNLANGELAVNITDGKLFYKDNGGVVRVLATAAGSAGDVVGPGSSTDNALVRFDGTTGKLVQSSVGVLSDAGVLTGLTGLTSSGSITFSGLTSGRVTYAGTGGLLQDSANLTFDGTTLTANALTVSNAVTLSGGTANGVAYLNGSKVLTTGSALTFDGTNFATTGRGSFGQRVQVTGNTAPSTGSGLELFYDGTVAAALAFARGTGYLPLGLDGSDIRFYASSSEQMRLTSTGLGIGTSSPLTALDVASAAGSPIISLTASGAWRYQILTDRSTQTFRIRDQSAGNLDRVIIDSSGNLGLGVTPSAWVTLKTLEIAGLGNAISGFPADAGIYVTSNAYYGSAGWRYGQTGKLSTRYSGEGGIHSWSVAPSGTAGNAISFTRAMTLGSSGELIIGDTTRAQTAKLTIQAVAGSSKFGVGPLETSSTNFFVVNTSGTGVYLADGATSWTANSDERQKDIIEPIENAAEKVGRLRAVIGKYKTDESGVRRSFLIAQDVQAVLPEAVVATNPDSLGVMYTDTIPLLVAAIQEQQAIINQLKADVAALTADVAASKGAA